MVPNICLNDVNDLCPNDPALISLPKIVFGETGSEYHNVFCLYYYGKGYPLESFLEAITIKSKAQKINKMYLDAGMITLLGSCDFMMQHLSLVVLVLVLIP